MPARGRAPVKQKGKDMPIPEECGLSEEDQNLTAHQLLEDLKKDRARQAQLIEEAEQRERWVLGEQWFARDPLVESTHTESFIEDTAVTENLLYPLSLTYTARVNEGRVMPIAGPVHPTPEDAAGAQASNQVLEYERRRTDEDKMIAEAGQLAQYHGDCLFLPYWDENDGPHLVRRQKVEELYIGGPEAPVFTPDGQPAYEEAWEYGGIAEELIAAPDYWTNIVDDYDRADYVVVRRVIPKQLARMMLDEVGMFDAKPGDKTTTSNPADLDNRGVETFEVYHKPGSRFGAGLCMKDIGGFVVECGPYKYEHGELPGDVWKIGKVRWSPRGKTHIADAIHQQRIVNNALKAILARLQVSGLAVIIGPDEQVSQVPRSGFRRIPSQLPKSKDIRIIEGGEVPNSLFAAYDRARRALYDVFGINEATTTGGNPSDTKSGEQLKTSQALDAQKIAPARRNLEHARLRVARQKLELARQYWDDARLIRVVGPDGAVAAQYFKGSDLMGADVTLEAGSGVLNSRIAGQRVAEERAAAGYITPQQGAEMSMTGLDSTVGDSELLVKVDNQGILALKGQPQTPVPGVSTQAAVQHLQALLMSTLALQGDRGNLMRLIQAYQQAGAQAQQQPGQSPGQAGQPTQATPSRLQPQGMQPQRQQQVKPTQMSEMALAPKGFMQ